MVRSFLADYMEAKARAQLWQLNGLMGIKVQHRTPPSAQVLQTNGNAGNELQQQQLQSRAGLISLANRSTANSSLSGCQVNQPREYKHHREALEDPKLNPEENMTYFYTFTSIHFMLLLITEIPFHGRSIAITKFWAGFLGYGHTSKLKRGWKRSPALEPPTLLNC